MKILIAGGTGHLGTLLTRHFRSKGQDVVVLSRKPTLSAAHTVFWDGRDPGPWMDALADSDIVINLSGRSVDCRYNARNRRRMTESRIYATRAIGQAIRACKRPPELWLQMSTATIYAHTHGRANDEETGILGGTEIDAPDAWRFSVELARDWEQEARLWQGTATRLVLLRTAMVMSTHPGGVFDVLAKLTRSGLGGKMGRGRQLISWLHERDFTGAVDHVIACESLEGPVNLAAPNPIDNTRFMRCLRRAMGVRFGLPAPRFLLEVGALFLRTETELVLKSRKVVPGRLLETGFGFAYPQWIDAAIELTRRRRGAGGRLRGPAEVSGVVEGEAI